MKGYAAHEKSTFEEVTCSRTLAQEATGIAEQAAAENMLTGALRKLFALAEAYPGAEGERELPSVAGGTRRDREQDPGVTPDLTTTAPHLQ